MPNSSLASRFLKKIRRLVIGRCCFVCKYLPVRCLQHFFHDVQTVVFRGPVQQVVLPMSTGFDRWWMLLDEVFQLCAQVRVVASVVLDQVDDPVDDWLQTVDGEESILAMFLNLVVPELCVIIN